MLFSTILNSAQLGRVSLQLQLKHQFQFAGYYIAKENGFYKASNLDVQIKEFNYGINPVDVVLNDKYGHDIEDKSLKKVANILKENIREVDKLCRWGGEELLIICPETNTQKDQILVENLRQIISSYKFDFIDTITCSFGIPLFDVDYKKDDTFIKTDKALYIAKNETQQSKAQ